MNKNIPFSTKKFGVISTRTFFQKIYLFRIVFSGS